MPGLLDTFGNIGGALTDKRFWGDVGHNAAYFLNPNDTPTTQGLPTRDQMKGMPWEKILALRNRAGLSQQDQNYIAPYEHRAYSRDFVRSPYDLLENTVLTAGYTPHKQFTGGGRSQPSMNEVVQGLLGGWEGFSK